VGRDGKSYSPILISDKQKYFFKRDWTGQISLIRLNKSGFRKTPAGGPDAAQGAGFTYSAGSIRAKSASTRWLLDMTGPHSVNPGYWRATSGRNGLCSSTKFPGA
jgi:hypothetical protein